MISASLILISYLMGSICSAIIVCRIFSLPDPRFEGSQNPGATNVLRIAGKKYAALVLVVDVIKGILPVALAKAVHGSPGVVAFTVLAAVVGHMYPIFFNFKGGKGVATAIGALLGFHLIVGVMVAATWLLVVKFSRYSSLASLVAITLSPLYALLVTKLITIFFPLFIMVILILYKHKSNITRLMDGSEPKVFVKENVLQEIMGESEQPDSSASKLPLKEYTAKKIKPKSNKAANATQKKLSQAKNQSPTTAKVKIKASEKTPQKKKITAEASKTKPKKTPKPKTPKIKKE